MAMLAAASRVSNSFSCRKAASSPAPKLPGAHGWRGRDPVPAQPLASVLQFSPLQNTSDIYLPVLGYGISLKYFKIPI